MDQKLIVSFVDICRCNINDKYDATKPNSCTVCDEDDVGDFRREVACAFEVKRAMRRLLSGDLFQVVQATGVVCETECDAKGRDSAVLVSGSQYL